MTTLERIFPCPRCGADLCKIRRVEIGGFVRASEDPEGKSRLELLFTCDACDETAYAFLAHDQLIDEEGQPFAPRSASAVMEATP